jgi:hypothetical protein
LSHEMSLSLGAETFSTVERNMRRTAMRGPIHPAGVVEHITSRRIASETGRSRVWPMARCPQGPRREAKAEADDVRTREVGRGRSSYEAGEQGGAIRGGVGGAKGRGQGECRPAPHTLDSVPGHVCHRHRPACAPPPQARGRLDPRQEPYAGKPHVRICAGGRGAITVPTVTAPRETHHCLTTCSGARCEYDAAHPTSLLLRRRPAV